jgi:HK97 family phage major capsid protein
VAISDSDISARAKTIRAELDELDTYSEWSAEQRARFEDLEAELRLLATERSRNSVRRAAMNPANLVTIGDAPDSPTRPAGDMAGRARATIDAAHRSGTLPDKAAETATRLVESGPARERSVAAQWATVTGDPAYGSAFRKLLSDPERGHLLWDSRELAAYQRVQEFRAMSLTDAAGGYMVPLTLDPAILLTSAGSNNPLRQISRVVQTTSDTWQGVSSAGVTAEWLAEAAEAADASPTLAGPSIPVYKGAAFIPFSYEVGMDAIAFSEEVGRILVDGADQLMAAAYTAGTGSGQPTGIVTALAGTSSEINAATDDVFAAADVFTLQDNLPARFSANASWCAHIAIQNKIKQFETANGALKFPEVAEGRLLGKPLYELSNMDGVINTTGAVSNFILLYGDFGQGFVIADRIGSTVELIPNLVGSNRRPTGQRGMFLWFRTGSDSVIDGAFRLLDVASAA